MNSSKLKEQIENALKPLIYTRLADIGRAHTLEWILFSPTGLLEANTESDQKYPEYSLNIQCTWRITRQGKIVVASDDLYFPPGDHPYDDLENFDWSRQGSNLGDVRTNLLKEEIANNTIVVLSVEADYIGGLSIQLSEGYSIELFPANSLEREYWRFFNRQSSDQHFVVTGSGIEESSE
jgi:hypothetical protein